MSFPRFEPRNFQIRGRSSATHLRRPVTWYEEHFFFAENFVTKLECGTVLSWVWYPWCNTNKKCICWNGWSSPPDSHESVKHTHLHALRCVGGGGLWPLRSGVESPAGAQGIIRPDTWFSTGRGADCTPHPTDTHTHTHRSLWQELRLCLCPGEIRPPSPAHSVFCRLQHAHCEAHLLYAPNVLLFWKAHVSSCHGGKYEDTRNSAVACDDV
jgi:hypothetical protein